MRLLALIAIVLLTSPGPTDAQVPVRRVSGVVVDESGAPVPGASVRLLVAGARASEVHTTPDGRFALEDVPPGDVILEVRASGFAETARPVGQQEADSTVRVVLGPAALSEAITVTASRGADSLATPAATSVLTSADLLNAAAGALDDALRVTPGFSLFRRSSSRTANPTTQGVTLRGLAASGASRTLVLADGVPLNDPFGSWVYWNRVPQAAIDRVEVVRGAAGDVYGPDALGGVIQVLTFEPRRARVRAVGDVASRGTGRISAIAGGGRDAWSGSVAGDWLETDGTYIVARADRGNVDVPAGSDSRSAFLTLRFDRDALGAGLRGGLSSERRGNGTPLQKNATDWRQLAGEVTGTLAGGAWVARASGGTQRYDQTFSAVSSDRSSERLTSEQQIRSAFASGSGQWVRSWGPRVLLVGGEARRVASDINQTTYAFSGTPSAVVPFGGTETGVAAFGRLRWLLADRGFLTVGARGERWTSDPLRADDPRHAKGFVSPRVAVGWQLHPQLSAQASAYRAYRTPTLNELHRGFRVGNVVTGANPRLDPERLTGVDGSLLVTSGRASARITGFLNDLDAAVANVTLSVTPALIVRERQNAGRIRAPGLEVEVDLRPHRAIRATAQATFTWSRFRATPAFPELEGNHVPQVPDYQVGAGITYADASTLTLAVQLRAVGAQFDDDQNELELRRFVVLDAYASRTVGAGVHVFVAVENLFDVEYDVGRTPVRAIGWPRTLRGGLRWFLP